LGVEAIMVNCNPETVSTDYDTSDRLYFEPLTLEDVLNIVEKERPLGVVVQLGGQTPLKLAGPLQAMGVPVLGTSPDAIDRAEDQIQALREQTEALAKALGVVGLINVQFAIRQDTIYVLEVNPRASRTVPFVSKAIGVPLAKLATRALLGHSLAAWAGLEQRELAHIAVKESVFPFVKF